MHGYTETILKYASDDSHTGTLEHPDGIGEVGLGAEEAGRKLAVRFALQVDQDLIKQVRYQVFGCGYTMAACAAAAELAEGDHLTHIAGLASTTVAQRLGGLPEDRSYCAELALKALQAAVTSVQEKNGSVAAHFEPLTSEHGPRVTADHPVYRALIDNTPAKGISDDDRHLFACLLTLADQEPAPLHQALNLSELMLETLLLKVFPGIDSLSLFSDPTLKTAAPPEINPDVQKLLLGFLRKDSFGWPQFASLAMARIIAGRATHPGHLWVAMGLFERPELSAAIGRHLPSLLTANDKGMRWKRYLFKQVCELNGGLMCKSPVCGDCSDYALCFAPEDK